MSTLLKITVAAVLVRAVMYVVRKRRSAELRDAEPPVAEPIPPEDLNVAQNAPL
jgi:hypothetical protein